MIVPQYWAEARLEHGARRRRVVVRRFGWSDVSQAEAQAHADQRAREVLQRVLSGEKLVRREPRLAYNGADGAPIREEIVSRLRETIITRNAYGARCLNTPNVLFADIDFAEDPPVVLTLTVYTFLLLVGLAWGWSSQSLGRAVVLFLVSLFLGGQCAKWLYALRLWLGGGREKIARNRVAAFVAGHPGWQVRLYRTPAGLRVLALHRTFDPAEPAVAECFRALGTDPLYARMCLNQRCFRARVSPKPWRIGIEKPLRPRPGVWPVAPERLPERQSWVARYEEIATGFAACRYLESLGTGPVDPVAQTVQIIHDDLSLAAASLPLA